MKPFAALVVCFLAVASAAPTHYSKQMYGTPAYSMNSYAAPAYSVNSYDVPSYSKSVYKRSVSYRYKPWFKPELDMKLGTIVPNLINLKVH